MNSKGQGLQILILLFIGVVILFMIGFYLGGSSDKFNSIFKLFSFNNSVELEGDKVLVGYNFVEEDLEYYDEVKWKDFTKSSISINNEEYESEELLRDISNYYSGNRDDLSINLSDNAGKNIFGEEFLSLEFNDRHPVSVSPFLRVVFKSVYLTSILDSAANGPIIEAELQARMGELRRYGTFLIDYKGDISFLDIQTDKVYRKIGKNDLSDDHKGIISEGIVWRDSVFDDPIDLKGHGSFRAEHTNGYLVVRLDEEV